MRVSLIALVLSCALLAYASPAYGLRYTVKGRLASPPDVPASGRAEFFSAARVLLDGGALVVSTCAHTHTHTLYQPLEERQTKDEGRKKDTRSPLSFLSSLFLSSFLRSAQCERIQCLRKKRKRALWKESILKITEKLSRGLFSLPLTSPHTHTFNLLSTQL